MAILLEVLRMSLTEEGTHRVSTLKKKKEINVIISENCRKRTILLR